VLPWRQAIDDMLVQCDAAVVLVTDDALESPSGAERGDDPALALRPGIRLRDQHLGFALVPVLWAGADPDRLMRRPLWARSTCRCQLSRRPSEMV
jgi:hypothetical protein